MATRQELTIEQMVKMCLDDSEKWFGDGHTAKSIPHHTLAMAGEVGEVANIVKKIERGSLNLGDANVRFQLMMELTDVFTYWLNLVGLVGMNPTQAFLHVRSENEKRFTAQRAEREGK